MAPTTKTSLRSVINEVTKEKLAWLDKERITLTTQFAPILTKFEDPKNKNSLSLLKEIHTALESLHSANPIPRSTQNLSVFLNWMQTEDENAAIYLGSRRLVQTWIETLVKHIKFRIEKYEYSCLYSNVMSQYMQSHPDDDHDDVEVEDPKSTPPTTKTETINEFCRLVFSKSENFDKKMFDDFLYTQLFDEQDPGQKKILLDARTKVRTFCKSFERDYKNSCGSMNEYNLRLCIDGLLRNNPFSGNKTRALKDLRDNTDAMEEVCALLNKRLKNFTQWSWPEPVYVDFRRNIAGRYRAYMDEDILTALFVHFVGAEWSILLKSVLQAIYNSSMWKRGSDTMAAEPCYISSSIEGYRREFHKASFLSTLPSTFNDLAKEGGGYDEDQNYHSQSRRGYRSSSSYGSQMMKEFSPVELKKKLIHLISNEIHLNYAIRPSSPLTVVQTDVQWFGPSIVHEAIFSVMKFFGATTEWLLFFKRFLEAPLLVGSPKAPVQNRKRGSPISHTFTSLFGETLLFIMDLYVNQVSGVNIYRVHDDFWFWSTNQESIIKAWTAMQTFTKLADLKLNESKSASVVCSKDAEQEGIVSGPVPLPQGKVKWGFVVLHSDGIYRISEELLKPHVKEMADCLQKSDCVVSWINVHNKYIRFFIRNFVEPAKTLQRQHVVQIIEALQSILIEIHPVTNGDAVATLKLKFPEIWGDKEVLDSWVHWPVEEGGLNLYNPFLTLLPLHDAYKKQEDEDFINFGSHLARFQEKVIEDEWEWNEILEESKRRNSRHGIFGGDDGTVTEYEIFGSNKDSDGEDEGASLVKRKTTRRKRWETRVDYNTWCKRTREAQSYRWRKYYVNILDNIDASRCIGSGSWRECLYQRQLHSKLGRNENFVDPKMVPLSLISSMRLQGARVHKN